MKRGTHQTRSPRNPARLNRTQATNGLVVQRVQIGEYVTPGLPLADVWCSDDRREALVASGIERFGTARPSSAELNRISIARQ